jgi:acetyltransferase-like isoleucine patch superfamily enzyme
VNARRSAFAKPLVHAPPGVHEPWRLLVIRLLIRLIGRRTGPGRLAAFADRLHMAELWRTNVLDYRVERARRMGMKVGERCRLYSLSVAAEPELVELGNGVIVSGDVMFVTHDGAIFTALERFQDVNGHYGRIRIGDDCFLGMRAIVMPGVELGANCVVAAGAVVMDSFPPNSVIAGNPATYVAPTAMYLKLKQHSPATICDPRYPFPEKLPSRELAERMADVPFKAVRRRESAVRRGPAPVKPVASGGDG